MASTAIGIGVLVALMVAWVGVQTAWRRMFPHATADPDALYGRTDCHGCDEIDHCRHRPASRAVGAKEEIS
jgi:hypothetical protein